LPLFVGVVARQLGAEFLLPRFSQLHNPVGKAVETFLDQGSLQAVPAQFGPHPDRSMAPSRMIGHEILGVAPVIEQFLGTQGLEQRCDDRRIVTLLEQLTAQIPGSVVAAGERIESRRACRPRIERLYLAADQGATPL